MRYYSITVKHPIGKLQSGEHFYNAKSPLSLGQQPSANIQLPCDEDLLPQNFCVITNNTKSNSWQLVKQTDFYPVLLNGEEIAYVGNLHDGDVITVGGATFLFKVHNDDNYSVSNGIVIRKPKQGWTKPLLWCASLLLVLAVSIGYPMIMKNRNGFTKADNRSIRASVYKILVTEVMLQQHTPDDPEGVYSSVDTCVLDSISVGTCFFTEDSLCVTARHCVEPWVDFSAWSDDTKHSELPRDVSWALLAEQSQLEQADTLYRIVSHCLVLEEDSCIYEFTSDQCSFNRSRDIIIRLGDDLMPWRVIYPLYKRKDVELGDFAFVKTTRKGELELATDAYLSKMNSEEDSEVRIFGYPKKNHGNLWEYQIVSHVTIPEMEDSAYTACLQLNVSGTGGYSGSPVIEKKNGRLMVVGIFSKIDDFDDSKQTFYAVPASEVSQYNSTKANEKIQYRR